MARRKTAYQKAMEALEREGRKQCFVLYGATAMALWKHWEKRQNTITRLFDITSEVWQTCASTNEKSMIEMCETETGIEVQCGDGKSWENLLYLNGRLPETPLTNAQMVYMRQQQKKWIAPQVMACLMVALHRKYGFGYDRLVRIYAQIKEIEYEFDSDEKKIREACFQLTGIDVADSVTKAKESA